MKSNILTLAEINNLCSQLRILFLFMHEMRKGSTLAAHIKLPQVPPILSESIVAHLIRQGKILSEYHAAKISRGSGADIMISQANSKTKVEVKATSEMGFQRMNKPDVVADFLVWLHFDKYFVASLDSPLSLFIIPQPGNYFKEKEESLVKNLDVKVGAALQKVSIRLSELDQNYQQAPLL